MRNLPDRVLAYFAYEGKTKDLIHSFKYEDNTSLARALGERLFELIQGVEYKDFVLVNVPLSRQRFLYRGYNQAELLAKSLSEKSLLPAVNLLARKKGHSTQVQSGTRKKRKENIRGCFYLNNREDLPGKVLLVDDVVTSGATVEEATKVLKRGGAKEVIVLTVAMGK